MKSFLLLLLAFLCVQCASMKPEGATPAEQRAFIDGEAERILAKLAEEEPDSTRELAAAEGHAVFRYTSGKMPLILGGLGAGSGYGVAVDDDQRTYMKIQKLNWGWGMGVKENAVVFIFDDAEVFEKFRRGKWDSGAAAEATVKADELGGGIGASATQKEGFKAYELSESGLSYGITYRTRRFSPTSSLNR
ncbi:hypothetical protein [uncultured Microbulbifer sp.]|uniref:hypothetical protein n=1 Tax=uncultured Microbulbifer sp. TaxID=348147 RepID=UPI0025E66109|nr:hypothetical protein [uncultured Microbulbifer sp.]